MANAGERDRRGLGQQIKDRRAELGLSIVAAAAAAGINRNTWRSVEHGERETEDYTYGNIERALAWRPGTIAAIRSGRAPAPSAHHRPAQLTDAQWSAAEALYKSIRDNKNRSPLLRAMASSSLEQLAAIRAADQAEEGQASSG